MVVYASIYPIYDFAKKIAGDAIRVDLLLPPGQSPMVGNPVQDDGKYRKEHRAFYTMDWIWILGERLAKSISSGGFMSLP